MASAVIVVIGDSIPDGMRYSFDRRMLPGVDKQYAYASDKSEAAGLLASSDCDLAYVVDSHLRPSRVVGRAVLPGIKHLVVEADGIVGGDRKATVRYISGEGTARNLGPGFVSRYQTADESTTFLMVPDSPSGNPESCSILVAVLSCCKCLDRRQAIRDTWASDLPVGMGVKFYVGDGESTDLGMDDIVQVGWADDYRSVPGKQMEFYRWVLENCEFDWLFQCDDDTYVAPDRLPSYVDSRYDMIGRMFRPGLMHGGVGYFFSRDLLTRIVDASEHLNPYGNGDVRFSQMASRCGASMRDIRMGEIQCRRGTPVTSSSQATTHYVSPEYMRRLHTDYIRLHPDTRNVMAVCVACTGKYFSMLDSLAQSVRDNLVPGMKKVMYVFTDADEADVAKAVCGLPYVVVPMEQKSRVWFFMHKTAMLAPILDDLEKCAVVAMFDVTIRLRCELRWDDVYRMDSNIVLYSVVPGHFRGRCNQLMAENRRRGSCAVLPDGASFGGWGMDCVKFVPGTAIRGFVSAHTAMLHTDESRSVYPAYHAESYNVMYMYQTGKYTYRDDFWRVAWVADKTHIGIPGHDGGMAGTQCDEVY